MNKVRCQTSVEDRRGPEQGREIVKKREKRPFVPASATTRPLIRGSSGDQLLDE